MRTIGKVFQKEQKKSDKLTKKDVMKLLAERGIEFSKEAGVEELRRLLEVQEEL